MTFRVAVLVLLLTPALVAQQPPRLNGVYPVTRTQFGLSYGAVLSFDRAEIYAADNKNDRFTANVFFPGTSCNDSILQLDGQANSSVGYGSNSNTNTCDIFFPLTPDQAMRAAAFFRTTRQDRHETGERLSATFSVSDSLELVVRITNPPDAPPVQWQHGGRNRGNRDNQFSMRITRDGQPVLAIEAYDFGGLSGLETLGPGQSVEVRAPISSWGDISKPGRYVVDVAYETVLIPPGLGLHISGHLGDVWDRRFEGKATFEFH